MRISRLGALAGSLFVVGACSATHVSTSNNGDGHATGGSGGASVGDKAAGAATGGSAETGGITVDPPPPGCPFIACVSGAWIRFPITVSLAEAVRSRVQVCRNDECYEGSWKTTEEPSGDSGIGFGLPDFGDQPQRRDELMSPIVGVTLWRLSTGAARLDVQWMPWSDSDLKDGDRYRVTMTNAQGRTLIRFDRPITYADNSSGSADCPLSCASAHIDVAAADECPDCGAGPEDGGAMDTGRAVDAGKAKDGG